MCRPTPAIGTTPTWTELGYATPIALATALGEWLRIHTWSLNTLVDSTVYLEGGIDSVLSSGSPVFYMEVTARPTTTNEGNPAAAFQTVGCYIIRKEEYPAYQHMWSKIEVHCDSVAKQLQARGIFDQPIFGGLLPAMYLVHEAGVCVFQTHAVLRLPIRHVKDDPQDQHTRAALRALQEMMMGTMSFGSVYRCAATAAQPEPYFGIFARDGREWKWQCQMDPRVWDDFDKNFGPLTERTTDVAPRALVSLFDTQNSTLRLAPFIVKDSQLPHIELEWLPGSSSCPVVVYCSRECQKAAWSTHKPMCISKPDPDVELQPSDLGYPSALSLQNALREWIEIQRWSLYTLTCALVQLAGGPEAVLASQETALVLHVIPRHHSAGEHGGNPAMAFRFGRASITGKSSDDDVRANWADIQENIKLVHDTSTVNFTLLSETKSGATGCYELMAPAVGTLPVVYVVHRMGVVRCHAFALFHRPLCHVQSQDVANARTRAALEELVRMMEEALSSVIVYRESLCPLQLEPDGWICEAVGKRRKTWTWRRLPADEEMRRKREELLDRIVPGRTSGLTAPQVLTLFNDRKDRCSQTREVVRFAYVRR
ncbi:hypothetical protein V8D89_003627 [Ganoderma adspersum]